MGEGRTQRLGVEKRREQRCCRGPQMWTQISPKAFAGGARLGGGYPCTHPPTSYQGSCVCCIKHSAFAVACKVFGCFMLCFKGNISAGAFWWLGWCCGQPEMCPGCCERLSPRTGLQSSPLEVSPKPP